MSNLHISFCFCLHITKTKNNKLLSVARFYKKMFKGEKKVKIKRQIQRPNPAYSEYGGELQRWAKKNHLTDFIWRYMELNGRIKEISRVSVSRSIVKNEVTIIL